MAQIERIEMETKEKYRLEYEIKSSPKILFNYISTASGLSGWFADDVTVRDGVYMFKWMGDRAAARLLTLKENKLVKFKWEDDEPYCFFELEIQQDELTGDVALCITDFCTPSEKEERRLIWDSQVDELIGLIGA